MKKQRTGASRAPHAMRWAGAALAAASLSLAPTSSAAAELQSVQVATANFRAGPSTKHPVLFSADRFYPVEIVERHKDWARIRDFEGDDAWIASWLLGNAQTVVVTRNVINVREKPNTTSTIVHTAERGAVFKLAKTKGSWVKVADEEGEIGWVHRNLLWGDLTANKAKPKGPADQGAASKTAPKAKDGAKPKAPGNAKPKAQGNAKPKAQGNAKPKRDTKPDESRKAK